METQKNRHKHQKGYWLIKAPSGHPYANLNGLIPEHRLVMEKAINRYINPIYEDVHHIDGNVQNNNLDNLQVLTKKEHRRYHAGWLKINNEWWKTCKCCGNFLKVIGNFSKRNFSHNEFVSECKACRNSKQIKKSVHHNFKCPNCKAFMKWDKTTKHTCKRCNLVLFEVLCSWCTSYNKTPAIINLYEVENSHGICETCAARTITDYQKNKAQID